YHEAHLSAVHEEHCTPDVGHAADHITRTGSERNRDLSSTTRRESGLPGPNNSGPQSVLGRAFLAALLLSCHTLRQSRVPGFYAFATIFQLLRSSVAARHNCHLHRTTRIGPNPTRRRSLRLLHSCGSIRSLRGREIRISSGEISLRSRHR